MLIAIVLVEGGAADLGAIENVLHRNVLEPTLLHERHEGIAQRITSALDSLIHLSSWCRLFGHTILIVASCGMIITIPVHPTGHSAPHRRKARNPRRML